MESTVLGAALALLRDVTPLKTDCGAYCFAACCKDNGEAGSGVWLLDGENADHMEWAKKYETRLPVTGQSVKAVYCLRPCRREARPFLCRIFPLTPYYSHKKQRWSVRMDRRAAAICPLFPYGKNALTPEFVSACEEAVNLLATDKNYEEQLKALEAEEAAFRMEL